MWAADIDVAPLPETYRDIFNARGLDYHTAMDRFPNARALEFKTAVALADLRPGARVADIPSGGGYLQRFLPTGLGIELDRYETSEQFSQLGDATLCTWSATGAPSAHYDAVISVAGLHHLHQYEITAFYREAARMLRPGGKLVIGEVTPGSRQAEFLNGYVNAHNPLGHDGRFLEPAEQVETLESLGYQSVKAVHHSYPWRFPDMRSCLTFFRGLFGIEGVSDRRLELDIKDLLKVTRKPGEVAVGWGLTFFAANKQG